MGSSISTSLESLFNKEEARILMVGLKSGGKTTILQKLCKDVNSGEYKNFRFTVWDITDENPKVRVLWRHYYENTLGLVFVVDSSDRENIGKAKEELNKMLGEEKLRDVTLLVLANKQDLGGMTLEEVTQKMDLANLKERRWHVQGTCALTKEGLEKGLKWLENAIFRKK